MKEQKESLLVNNLERAWDLAIIEDSLRSEPFADLAYVNSEVAISGVKAFNEARFNPPVSFELEMVTEARTRLLDKYSDDIDRIQNLKSRYRDIIATKDSKYKSPFSKEDLLSSGLTEGDIRTSPMLYSYYGKTAVGRLIKRGLLGHRLNNN